jgi:hypothetical protein
MRVVNRLGSLLLAFVLLAGGLLLAAEGVAAALDRPLLIDRAGWYATLTGARLDHPVVRAVLIAATVVGLLVLAAQLRRWTPERLAVQFGDGWHLQRRSVERQLASTADGVPGVSSARARIRRRGTSWRPRIRAVGDPAVRPAVERAVREELARLSAPQTDPVQIEMVPQRGLR